jgi:hypothetical protein
MSLDYFVTDVSDRSDFHLEFRDQTGERLGILLPDDVVCHMNCLISYLSQFLEAL